MAGGECMPNRYALSPRRPMELQIYLRLGLGATLCTYFRTLPSFSASAGLGALAARWPKLPDADLFWRTASARGNGVCCRWFVPQVASIEGDRSRSRSAWMIRATQGAQLGALHQVSDVAQSGEEHVPSGCAFGAQRSTR